MMFTETRRRLFPALAVMLLTGACSAEAPDRSRLKRAADDETLIVYHDPSCGCCGRWIDHLRRNGLRVQSIEQADMGDVKRRLGVPEGLRSCHTAIVGDYVIEGHVPATDVKRLLERRPGVHGLSVPGMPLGSPGMEYGGRRQAYDVVSFEESGASETFNHYRARR